MFLDGCIKVAPSKLEGVGIFSNNYLKKGKIIFNFKWDNYKSLRNIEHFPEIQKIA